MSRAEKKVKEREIRLEIMELTSKENLKPTSLNEFRVLYNKAKDFNSEFKAKYEETREMPNITEDERLLLMLYNVPVNGNRSQLSLMNYNIGQIDKRIKQIGNTKGISEDKKQSIISQLETRKNLITDRYMDIIKTRYSLDIKSLFK